MDKASGSRQLLSSMLTAGTIGFGGGSALIPVMERLTVHRSLLSPETVTRHVVVANITPGAQPVKLAAAAGFHRGGTRLSLAAALLVALPGALATLILLVGLSALGDGGLALINYASVGITAFIMALLANYVIEVHREADGAWPLYLAITLVTAGALRFLHLSAVQVIVAALVIITVIALLRSRAEPRGPRVGVLASISTVRGATLAFVALTLVGAGLFVAVAGFKGLEFAGLLTLSTLTSFGGGAAYIGVADGFFVRSGLISEAVFYTQLVPVANALPGPILVKVGVGSSYLFGTAVGPVQGWLLGLAGMFITVGACCAVALPLLGLYQQLKDHPVVVGIGRYILPVICGLLVTVAVTMVEISTAVMVDAGAPRVPAVAVLLAAAALMTVLHVRRLVPDLVLLGAAGAASLAALALIA